MADGGWLRRREHVGNEGGRIGCADAEADAKVAEYFVQLLIATNGAVDPMAPLLKLLGARGADPLVSKGHHPCRCVPAVDLCEPGINDVHDIRDGDARLSDVRRHHNLTDAVGRSIKRFPLLLRRQRAVKRQHTDLLFSIMEPP